MHAFARSIGSRSLGFALVVAGIALAIVVITDESGSTAAMRVARMSALAPAFALVGGAVAIAEARTRGELRALEALGTPPWLTVLGVAIAGWLLGGIAAGLVASPLADVSALFPAVHTPAVWEVDGSGFVARTAGVRVDAAGELHLTEPSAVPSDVRAPDGAAALLWLGPLATIAPAWLVCPTSIGWRAFTLGASVLASLFLLHAVAAGQVVPGWLPAASVPLLLPLVVQAMVGRAMVGRAPLSSRGAP